jgi:hypothetical protein
VSFHLAEEQWSEIAKAGNLPPEAREEVDFLIGIFRGVEGDVKESRPSKTRRRLESDRKAVRRLIDNMRAYPAPVVAAMIYGDPGRDASNPIAMSQRLQQHIENLSRLEAWFEVALKRVIPRKTGRDASIGIELVKRLDALIYKYAGKNISRSENKTATRPFVTTVLQIAFPNIGKGSVDEAIKATVRWRKDSR